MKALFADERVPRPAPPRRRELDQLGPGDRPGRLLRDVSDRARRTEARPVSFAVPTGNFGNVFAGWVAQRMGLPDRAARHRLEPQRHPHPLRRRPARWQIAEVVPTLSPSMDIQVSSNFERLLFELNGRDGGLTAEQMARVPRESGRLGLEADQLHDLRALVRGREHRRAPRPLDADRRDLRASGIVRRPAHGGRGRAAATRVDRDPRRPAGRARDRASGEVPRRRREGDRRPARRCPPTSPTCSTDPSATRSWRTTSTR